MKKLKEIRYTELHLHTEFSFLDSPTSISDLANFCQEMEIPRVAITDHGNILGWSRAYIELEKRVGIKPIYGLEAYIVSDKEKKIREEEKYGHLVLLAENDEGIRNLFKLTKISNDEGFYYRPRIDWKSLIEHKEGLICLTACLGNPIAQLLQEEKKEKAFTILAMLKDIFSNKIFAEIQFNEIEFQLFYNRWLFDSAKQLGIKPVVTSDVHYLKKEHRRFQDFMVLMKRNKTLQNIATEVFSCRHLYMKGFKGIRISWMKWGKNINPKEFLEMVDTTQLISSMCNASLEPKGMIEPQFYSKKMSQNKLFTSKLKVGFKKLCSDLNLEEQKSYIKQLKYEIDVIKKKRLVNYFLIVADMVQFARNNDVPVGAGRGSVSGSLVSYLLEITIINPIQFGLYFDRFLNMARVDMPDIDLDFGDEKRHLIIDYMRLKYGQENVYPIITFITFSFKSLIRRLAKVFEIPEKEVNWALKETYEDDKVRGIENLSAIKSGFLIQFLKKYPDLKKIGDGLLGRLSHLGRHAAGIVISPEPLENLAPIVRSSNELHCGYDYTPQYEILAKLGFLKLDVLGIRTLTEIDTALKFVEKEYNKTIDTRDIPLDDEKVFELASRGETFGTFQYEGPTMQRLLKDIKPDKFQDLVAICALFRPGTKDEIGKYGRRKRQNNLTFPCSELEEILGETYGLIIYQEQVMELATKLGNATGEEADIFRQAISKAGKGAIIKRQQEAIEAINVMKKKIIRNAMKKGVSKMYIEEIWRQIEVSIKYLFNKAHATAYAWLGYVTLWVKVHYPLEFFAGLLFHTKASGKQKSDIQVYVRDAIRNGIQVINPDISKSEQNWSIENLGQHRTLRMGLTVLKYVGEKSARKICEERPFKNFKDFFERICGQDCNLRVMKSLIVSNSFRSFGLSVEEIWEEYCQLRGDNNELNISKLEALNGIILPVTVNDEVDELMNKYE